jgi:hypothetical protein
MTTPDPAQPAPLPSLPPAPWVLIDRTTVEQTATVLDLLEQWLASADPGPTEACARACSGGQADAFEVAAWVGCLAAGLQDRVEAADSAVDSWS